MISLSGFFYWQKTTPKRLAFETKELKKDHRTIKNSDVPEPMYLIIEDYDTKLLIFPAEIKQGKWQATTQGVSHLSSTPVPGQAGNSVLYGHNWNSLLGDLIKVRPGQEIKVTFSDGSIKKFKVTTTQTVSPQDTSILGPTNDKRITLYTCTGLLDTKRFVVTAVLQAV